MANTLNLAPPALLAGTKPGKFDPPRPMAENPNRRQNRRSKARSIDPRMVPMAPWDCEATVSIADLHFTTVRCVDLSDGGVAIVSAVLPRLTQACFRLVRDDQPVHLLARIKNIVEGAYEGRHQFRVGYQFTAILAPDGALGSMPK
jgi:hypothetical protein